MEIPDSSSESRLPGGAGNNPSVMDAVLTLRDDLKFDTRAEGSRVVHVIEDPVRGKFFQMGGDEFSLISQLDGVHSVSQIFATLNKPSFSPEMAVTTVQWLLQMNLAWSGASDSAGRLVDQANAIRSSQRVAKLNPVSIKWTAFNPDHLTRLALPWTQWIFSRWFLAIWIATALIAGYVFCTNVDRMGTASVGILSGYRWLWYLTFWIVLKIVHESAHAIACRRYGGNVTEAGVLLLLFVPMAFVNVTSMWRFANRWHRIVVCAAGMYAEMFIAFVALIVWNATDGLTSDLAFDIFIMGSLTTVLFNANPLMRFDGYFILADTLGITNLYSKGSQWFAGAMKRLYLGIPQTASPYPREQQWTVAIYGTFAFFWRILVSIGLTIGASVLFQGRRTNFGWHRRRFLVWNADLPQPDEHIASGKRESNQPSSFGSQHRGNLLGGAFCLHRFSGTRTAKCTGDRSIC